jgi:hypothetical protein
MQIAPETGLASADTPRLAGTPSVSQGRLASAGP